MKTAHHAVVVGGGFGGLAAANRLQSLGLKVTIAEKRERLGGRAYRFEEAGYVFDMGPSLITAPSIIDDVFRCAGTQLEKYVELLPLDPYYRLFFHDGSRFDYTGNADQMKREMRRFNAGDASRYDAFMDAVRPIYEAVIEEGLGAQPFMTIRSMLAFAPRALRLGAFTPVTKFANRYFRDFRHRFIFSFHPLFIGGNPFRAPSVYIMIPYLEKEQGVWFARGGMYALVDGLAKLFENGGGIIRTGSEVTQITVERGRVVGVVANGDFIPCDIVVSNADVAHTYGDLLNSPRRRWTDRRLRRLNYTMSCFLLYLGVRRTYPALAHHTLILTKRYQALLNDIFDRKVLSEDFSMYLHAPTKSDAGMAPPGCESLYVLVPVPNLLGDVDWAEMTPVMTNRILRFLEDWGLTGLRAHTEVLRTFTPVDFERELNAWHGNAFGPEPTLLQTAYFRPHNRSEEVDGLYIVGAGTHPGAGVPGVMLSAEATVSAIRKDWVFEQVHKPAPGTAIRA